MGEVNRRELGSLVIELPKDETLEARLRKKLAEYDHRLGEFAGNPQSHEYLDSWYKATLLRVLLDEKRIDIETLSRFYDLAKKGGVGYSAERLNNAFTVIRSYVRGDDWDRSGGTGLPEIE